MRILVSNDDGVFALGISILANQLKQIAEVKVVAPDRNRSGASNSLSLETPLRIKQEESGFIAVQGTPTDCVHLGLTGLWATEPFDMVVSGINETANLGDDILYSGTVAAAMAGRTLGVPSIAVSLAGNQHYQTAAVVAKQLVLQLKQDPLPRDCFLNVNVPDVPLDELKGFEITRLGSRHPAEPIFQEKDPRGKVIYWIGPPGPEQDAGEGTDFYAMRQKKVSITPLQLDLTHYRVFGQLANWLTDLSQI